MSLFATFHFFFSPRLIRKPPLAQLFYQTLMVYNPDRSVSSSSEVLRIMM